MRDFLSSALLAAALLVATAAQANNLLVSGVQAIPDPANSATYLRAQVGWDNSWRDFVNWDAAWVFAKFRRPGGAWQHATLFASDNQHSGPLNTALNAAADGKGVMVYRSGAALGGGTFFSTVLLRWDTATDGITPGQNYEVRVFGVEMVHIPAGAFSLNTAPQAANSNEFVSAGGSLGGIASEAALPAGALRWANETGGGGTGNPLTVGGIAYEGSDALGATYPKGFAASYCMKYEISQGQYADFLNCLTRTQQGRRVQVDVSGDSPAGGNVFVMSANVANPERNAITCPAAGMGTSQPVAFACARPDRAGNQLTWADGAAYLDWAGLRPMSELEYEKICRGPEPVVAGGYAWGSAAITAALAISGPEDGTETTDAAANAAFDNRTFSGGDGGQGPLRCGIFARTATTREQAGATYFGVMEMTANCWERCVTVAAADNGQPTNAGRFDGGQHGDGALAATGDHNAPTWPNSTDVLGSCFRGGNWSRPREWAAASDRLYGGQAIAGRTAHRSIRGLRSAASLGAVVPAPTLPVTIAREKFYGGPRDGYSAASGLLVLGTRPAAPALASALLVPNPVADRATLRLTGLAAPTDATLTLRDALGRSVLRITGLRGFDIEISRAGLASGLYYYELSEGGALLVPMGRLELK